MSEGGPATAAVFASPHRRAAAAAWVLAIIAIALGVLNVLMLVVSAVTETPGMGPPELWLVAPILLFFFSSPLVGALIVSRAQGNPIGWLFIVSSGGLALGFVVDAYATYALATGQDLTLSTVLRWAGSWVGVPAFGSIPLLALLFPDGRPASARWRPLVWTSVGGTLALALSEAFRPDVMYFEGSPVTEVRRNPLGVPAEAALLTNVVGGVGIALILVSALLGTVSLIVRFRRSRGIERQQLKWFVFAMATLSVLLAASSAAEAATAVVGDAATPASTLLGVAAISSLTLLPLAAGIAILRYRLYDIDLLINRTIVYGTLSVVLGGGYFVAIVASQTVLRPLTGGGEIEVAAATLLAVAAFTPLRRRIQDAVDRRFYRSRYDAVRTLDAFTGRLRDEVDLEQVRGEMLDVVGETLRPAHASVWLREARR